MVEQGASIVDIGGASYGHEVPRPSEDEERRRVIPLVEALVQHDRIPAPLSVDTVTASVAEAALDAGASLVNDCSGLADERLASAAARTGAALVVMHLKGELNLRRSATSVYADAMGEIIAFLEERTRRALALGVAPESIIVDPGLEFGKEPKTDLEILDRFADLRSLGYPILFASSRKNFIGRIFDRPARELLVASLATAALAVVAGARFVRAHDVTETVELVRMLAAVRPGVRATLELVREMPGPDGRGSHHAALTETSPPREGSW
jgi:dihydropteroate synthase